MESSDSVVDYKLSWAELKDVVNNLRKQLSSLSTMVPSSVTFRKLQDGRTRIYFLSAPQNGWETTLLFVDVPTDAVSGTSDSDTRLQWHCVIESNFPTISSNKFSREEQLLWERKRLATWGINSYELHDVSGKIIFPASSSLFQCIDSGYSTCALFPTKLRMNSSGAKLNPQICPTNSDLVAYICNHDIWVSHTVSGCNVRLTYAHKGGRSLADDPLCAGVPSYVMQEEFSRYQGYWWQPNSIGGIYRLLYEEVDDGDVKIFCFPSSQTSDSNTTPSTSNLSHLGTGNNISVGITGEMGTPNSVLGLTSSHHSSGNPGVVSVGGVASGVGCGDVEEFRFPRAGCANSKSYLKLIEFRVSDTRQVVDVVMLELQFSLSVLFPWMEYIVRADWTPDGEYIWVQLLDRRQQRLDLVLLSLNNFTEVLPMYDDSSSPDLSNPLVQVMLSYKNVIYSEESCVWINVHDLLCFLPSPDENEVQFIWASEETGFRHLYHVTSQILPYPNAVNGISEQVEYVSLQPKITRKVALTSGDWEVVGQDIWLDYERQLVYFMGLRETVLEKHLYVVSLRRPGEIRLLTTPGYSFVIDFNTECTMFLAVYSNVTQVPNSEIFRITHTDWSTEGVTLTSLGHLHQPHTNPSSTTTPYHSNTTAYHSNPTNTPYNPNNTTPYHQNATTTPYHQNTTTSYHQNTTTSYHQNATPTSFNPSSTTHQNTTPTSFNPNSYPQSSSLNQSSSTSCLSSSSNTLCCNNTNLGYAPPDLYTYTITSGTVLHAMVFKPHGYRPTNNNSTVASSRRRYPTVLNVYGGPEVQLVSNTFKGMRQLRLHMLAARGYCVVAIDSRGSQHRGLKFESHLRCKMGTVELADQVEVLHYLADTLGFIDLARVAIHGWSYGGYLSLMGLVQQPDVFKVAIAGAPVTNWALYDTGYTERYMDLPEQNEQGYTEGSVLNYINKFPEDENRLLIIHGLIDENVHFYHTSQLVSAMVKAGKPYQLQIYPNERHSLRHLDASKHYETTLLAFLQNHL